MDSARKKPQTQTARFFKGNEDGCYDDLLQKDYQKQDCKSYISERKYMMMEKEFVTKRYQ